MSKAKESNILKLMKCNNCFNSLHLEKTKNKEDTFHQKIKEDKDFLLNFFDQQPYYKESMPMIHKSYKGIPYYNGLIKGGLQRKSAFFKAILKAIKEIEEEKKVKPEIIKRKMVKNYSLPQIELLRRKAKKLNSMSIIKNKFNQNSSNISSYNDSNKNKSTNLNNTNNNSSILKQSFSVPRQDIKSKTINYDSDYISTGGKSCYKTQGKGFLSRQNSTMGGTGFNITNSSQISDFSKKNYIINKCKEEILIGKEVGGNFYKYNNKLDKLMRKKLGETMLISSDQKLIEEKSKKNKYKVMEKNNYDNIKKKMDKKISAVFAYFNRKEFYEILKNHDKSAAYDMYLKEMNNINEKLLKNKEIEDKRLKTVEEMLDGVYKQKEFLKEHITKYHDKNSQKKIYKYWTLKDDFYISRNTGDELKGTLLPKILNIKEKCTKNKSTGNFLSIK